MTKLAKPLPTLAYTVVDGKYHGASHEYSQSAWIHVDGHGPDLSQTEGHGPDFNLRTVAIAHITSPVYYSNRAEGEQRRADDIAVVAEIVKRANAYPKLVEALKESIALTPPDSAFLESRVALLREIGEAS